jgi:antitoxin component YwqK of YwqJK toxin-antitoxin module
MMKSRFLLLIPAFLLCLFTYGQEVTKKDILQHGISSITYIDSPGNYRRVEICNDQGDIIRSTHTFRNEVNDYINEYQYNDSFQPVRLIHFKGGKIEYSSSYFYTNGRLSRIETLNELNQVSLQTINYNGRGNKTKEVHALKGFPAYRTITYKYNERNLLTSETTVFVEHHNQRKIETIYSYDGRDQLIKTERKWPNSETYITTQVYDDTGRVREHTETSSGGRSSTTTYTYDSMGLLTSINWEVPLKGKEQGIRYTTKVIYSFGAPRKVERMLFVIDSVPILNDPDALDPVSKEDWAEMRVLRNKDSIKLLGWEEVDAITYIFTHAFRIRPDSLKRVPSHRQLEQKDGAWYLHGVPYSGRYIDYYKSGRIWNEGTMVQGKLDGPFIVYYQNGYKKSVAQYREGVLHGSWNDYYPNGMLMQSREFWMGKSSESRKEYFINGQLQYERRVKNETPYDTAVAYYSTGKVKKMTLFREGVLVYDKRWEDLRVYTNDFYCSLKDGDLKEANKAYYKLWKSDSASADTYFKGGLLMLKEFRFEEAIAEFNRALDVEPLIVDAFFYRALASIKKQKFASSKPLPKDFKEPPLTFTDFTSLPHYEQQRTCSDLQRALALGFTDTQAQKAIPPQILEHCK